MAVNPIQFIVAQNASITDGTKTISISGNVDCSRVYSGTAVFLGGADNPAEAVSGTSPNGSGVSTITLRNNWSQGDVVNQQLVSFNTNEGLAEAISNVREIVSNVSAIEDLATQGLIKRINDNEYEVVNISAIGEVLITANDASSQRGVLGLGSAATKNVGTVSGNVMEVGAFGVGGQAVLVNSLPNTMDDAVQGGFYYGFSGQHVNATPDGNPFPDRGGAFSVVSFGDNFSGKDYAVQIAAENSQNVFSIKGRSIADRSLGFTDWFEFYHSGNSVNPLDYGLKQAVTLSASDNLDDLTDSGFYYNGTAGNTPNNNYPLPSAGSLLVISRQVANNVTQTFIPFSPNGTATDVRMFVRSNGANGWTPWVETYHTGNTVNAYDHGIGRSTENPTWANSTLDDCSNIKTGVYRTSSSVASPDQTAIVYFMRRNNGQLQQILVSGYNASNTNTFQWRNSNGGTDAAPNWSDWKTVYHSGNTNFNEFGGTGADKRIGKGTCRGTTSAFIELPLNSVSNANSVSVTGTFRLTDHTGTNVLVDNIPANAFSLTNTKPSNKLFTLLVNVAGGLTGKDPVYLETVSSDAKIVPLF